MHYYGWTVIFLVSLQYCNGQNFVRGKGGFRVCEELHCPSGCELSFKNGCPHNCNCAPPPLDCPDIDCPLPFPDCIIMTRLDGCQECACEGRIHQTRRGDVVVVLPDGRTRDGKRPLKPPSKPGSVSKPNPRPSPHRSQPASRPRNQPRFTPAPRRFTPAPAPKRQTLKKFFPKGTPRPSNNRRFPAPAPKPQKSSFNRKGSSSVVSRPKPRPTPPPTRATFKPAPPAARATFKPTPPPTRATFKPAPAPAPASNLKPVPRGQKTQTNAAPPAISPPDEDFCSDTYKKSIDGKLSEVYSLLAQYKGQASTAFPPGYKMSESQIENVCEIYRRDMGTIDGKAVRLCRNQYEKFDEVVATFEYPCGQGTQRSFLKNRECIGSFQQDPTVQKCESKASQGSTNPSAICNVYNDLLECMHDVVREKCQLDGWEIAFQYLSLYVRQWDPDCRLHRIIRRVNAANTWRDRILS